MKKNKILFLLITLLSFCSVAFAELPGVGYTNIEINGETYSVPLPNKDYKQEVYYLKKALKGDKEALEIFMDGKEEKFFYIGDLSPKWIIVHKDGTVKVL